jgi:hypothetical protein
MSSEARPMPQYVLVYGPPDEPVVYTTLPPDTQDAAMASWECEQRYPDQHVRIMPGDAVPVPVSERER